MLTHAYLDQLIRNLFSSDNPVHLGTSSSTPMSGSGYSNNKKVSDFNVAFSGSSTSGEHSASNSSVNTNTVYFGEATTAWPAITHLLIYTTTSGFTGSPIFAGQLASSITLSAEQEIKIAKYDAVNGKGFKVTVSNASAS